MVRFALLLLATLGLVTLAMSWWAMGFPGNLGLTTALVAAALVAAAGSVLLRRAAFLRHEPGPADAGPRGRSTGARLTGAILATLVVAACLACLVNAVAWPFSPGDALAVYGPLGREIAAFGALPAGEWQYKAYPQHVPMLYAIVEWMHGEPSEEWSRAVAALYAVGTVATTWSLAREWRSPRAGWLGAALLVSMPIFTRWASSGYADVPAGFYVTLCTLLAWRWWRRPALAAAAACGAAAGLALWTKQSTVTLAASALVVPVAWAALARPRGPALSTKRSVMHLAVAALAALVIAAPWYARNMLRDGTALPVPPPYWTDQAQHDAGMTLLTLIAHSGLGLLGYLGPVLVALLAVRLRHADACGRAAAVLVLGVVVPYGVAWWWFVSYDPRFLVTVLPVMAAYGGLAADEWAERAARARAPARRLVVAAAAVALIASWAIAMRTAVEHKRLLWRAHLMDDAERHRLRVGSLYDIGKAIDSLPLATVVAGVPDLARYYIHPSRLDRVHWAGDESTAARRADFTVHRPGEAVVHTRDGAGPIPATTVGARCPGIVTTRTPDGYVICRREPAKPRGRTEARETSLEGHAGSPEP